MLATRFLAVSIVVFSSADHSATASTVRDLVKYCSSSIDTSDYSYCLGVMAGAEDLAAFAIGDDLVRNPLGTPDLNICLGAPDHAPGELADVFMAWAKAYPATWNWDEAYGLVAAFREKWPCGSIGR
jgi:Rap1a immunity proteins